MTHFLINQSQEFGKFYRKGRFFVVNLFTSVRHYLSLVIYVTCENLKISLKTLYKKREFSSINMMHGFI